MKIYLIDNGESHSAHTYYFVKTDIEIDKINSCIDLIRLEKLYSKHKVPGEMKTLCGTIQTMDFDNYFVLLIEEEYDVDDNSNYTDKIENMNKDISQWILHKIKLLSNKISYTQTYEKLKKEGLI